jgi:arylsulfatase A-like enzyme
MTRPNILLITSDQQRGDCYGFEGRAVKTPHLDAMAAGGTRFSTCITPNAVCQPSRASILTGLLPLNHGVHDNGIDLDEALGSQGFAGSLAAGGYRTGFIGKAHFATYHTHAPTGSPECASSSADYDADWFGPYQGFEHVELIHIGHNWWMPAEPPHGQHYERFFHRDGRGQKLFDLYNQKLEPVTDATQTWHSALPQSVHNSNWVADRTIDFMKNSGDEPFCVWASFPDPHHPFDAPEPWSRLHHPDEVDLPEHRTRDFDRRPFWHRAAIENRPAGPADKAEIRTGYSRIPPQSDRQLRDLIANYYGQISLIDHNVGRIMEALAEQGLDENTIVIYTTDHGDWLGDHGLILKGPMMYDGLMRVGMILQGPGVPAGRVVSDPVSTLDIGPTLNDFAGTSPKLEQHGKSMKPLIEGDDTSRDFAFNEWWLLPTRAGVELQLQTVRTERYRMSVDRLSGEGELYDFQEDPHEMDNRFDDPAYATVRKELDDMARERPTGTQTEPSTQVGMA